MVSDSEEERSEKEETAMPRKLTGLDLVAQQRYNGSPDKPLGKDALSVVRYAITRMETGGWAYPKQQYNKCETDTERRQFCICLSLHSEGAWLRVEEIMH